MKRSKRTKPATVYCDNPSVKDLIAFYDSQQAVDLARLPGHRMVQEPTSWVEVPADLVPEIERLVARRRKTA